MQISRRSAERCFSKCSHFFPFRMGTAAEYLSRTRIGAYFHETRGSRKLVSATTMRETRVYQSRSKLIDC